MEWITDTLKLLFGQLGVVGTVCFIISAYLGWMHYEEKEDHKLTRSALHDLVKAQATVNLQFMELLTEIRTYVRMKVNGKE